MRLRLKPFGVHLTPNRSPLAGLIWLVSDWMLAPEERFIKADVSYRASTNQCLYFYSTAGYGTQGAVTSEPIWQRGGPVRRLSPPNLGNARVASLFAESQIIFVNK